MVHYYVADSNNAEVTNIAERRGQIEAMTYSGCKEEPKKTWVFPAIDKAHLCLIVEELRIER